MMEEEKKAYKEWCKSKTDDWIPWVTELSEDWYDYEVMAGFNGGYHSRDTEINELKEEVERLTNLIETKGEEG